jgi:hypothetical protein
MSLRINSDNITQVLLADGWHRVMEGTFDIDAYEIHDGAERGHEFWILRGGIDKHITSSGFTFKDPDADGEYIRGPLTSILAIRETL